MKNTVLKFGFISGAIMAGLMLAAIPFHDKLGFETGGLIVGYTSMVLAFMLVYFGVRSYRDNVAGGSVRFGRALAVGSLIALVSSACYVATWEVVYYKFEPDFMDKYSAHVLEKARASGATEAALAKQRAEMDKFAESYKNPVVNVAVTFLEPLPVALIFALVTAGVLSRRKKDGALGDIAGARVAT